MEVKKGFLISFQNSFERPLFPGDLLFSIDFELLNPLLSDMIPSQLNICSMVCSGKGISSKYASVTSVWFITLRENKD